MRPPLRNVQTIALSSLHSEWSDLRACVREVHAIACEQVLALSSSVSPVPDEVSRSYSFWDMYYNPLNPHCQQAASSSEPHDSEGSDGNGDYCHAVLALFVPVSDSETAAMIAQPKVTNALLTLLRCKSEQTQRRIVTLLGQTGAMLAEPNIAAEFAASVWKTSFQIVRAIIGLESPGQFSGTYYVSDAMV